MTPRLVIHIEQYRKWNIFIQFHNNEYHVYGQRYFNKKTIFHTTIIGEHTTICYLDEILKYTKNIPQHSITLFYTDLSVDAPFYLYEECAKDRVKEIIGYDNCCLNVGKLSMYLGFVRHSISIEEYK